MSASLDTLENRRSALLDQIGQLGDFRPGSITTASGRCGNPNRHCHLPGEPAHGPHFRLSFRRQGKTVTESFPTAATRRNTQRQIAQDRKWQQLSRVLVALNTRICQLRPVEDTLTPREKNGRNDPARSRPRSRSAAPGDLPRLAQQRPIRVRSHRIGHSRGDASWRRRRAERVAVLVGSRAARGALRPRPASSLSRHRAQATAHRRRSGRLPTRLLRLPALPPGTMPARLRTRRGRCARRMPPATARLSRAPRRWACAFPASLGGAAGAGRGRRS